MDRARCVRSAEKPERIDGTFIACLNFLRASNFATLCRQRRLRYEIGMTVKETAKKQIRVGDGPPGPGRPKGVPNKTTAAAKQVIAEAAERLGGVGRLVEWAKEHPDNEKAFWASIYPKLIPLDVNANVTKTPSFTVHDFVMKPEAR